MFRNFASSVARAAGGFGALHQRATATLGGIRTKFTVNIDTRTSPEFAMAMLNRKLQRAGVMKKLRTRSRGFVKPSKVKYDENLKRTYKLSYRKVQNVLTWIEMERGLSAERRKASRAEKKGLPTES